MAVTTTEFDAETTYTCHTTTWAGPELRTTVQISRCAVDPANRCLGYWIPVNNCTGKLVTLLVYTA